MADYVPTYVLRNSTDTADIYTIPFVTDDNSPQDNGNYIEKKGLRGQGSVIIPGTSIAPWDLSLRFILQGANYEAVIALMDSLQTTIVKNTPYILKIGRTAVTTQAYNVKRILPFAFESGRRVRIQRVGLIFRVHSWA